MLSIDDTKDHSPNNNSFDTLSKFWDTKKRDFGIYMKEKEQLFAHQQQDIDSKIARYGTVCEASKAGFNIEITRMKNMLQAKTTN